MSIIVVSYNSIKTIEKTIKSIINQTYSPKEIIFVDGGSRDGTREMILKYACKDDVIIFEPDDGIYDAMNKGIKRATGEFTFILNSDDLYSNDIIIEMVVNKFNSDPAVDIVIGDIEYFKIKSENKTGRIWKYGNPGLKSFLNGWHPPHPGFFVRTTTYKNYGFFNTTFKIAADYDLMLRFIQVHKLKYIPMNIVTTFMEASGVSGSWKGRFRGLKDIVNSLKLNGYFLLIPSIIFFRYIRKIRF